MGTLWTRDSASARRLNISLAFFFTGTGRPLSFIRERISVKVAARLRDGACEMTVTRVPEMEARASGEAVDLVALKGELGEFVSEGVDG